MENNEKKKIIFTIIGVFLLAAITIGITYSYFAPNIRQGTGRSLNVTSDTVDELSLKVKDH